MKTKYLIMLLVIVCTVSCKNNNINENSISQSTNERQESINGENMIDIKIIIDNKEYLLNLENSETTEEFLKLLPIELTMNELNGNEKYSYLNSTLPSDSHKIKEIKKGDVMLFGNNCIVLFYKDFNTNYSYTSIGHIDNLPDFGNENISVKITNK